MFLLKYHLSLTWRERVSAMKIFMHFCISLFYCTVQCKTHLKWFPIWSFEQETKHELEELFSYCTNVVRITLIYWPYRSSILLMLLFLLLSLSFFSKKTT